VSYSHRLDDKTEVLVHFCLPFCYLSNISDFLNAIGLWRCPILGPTLSAEGKELLHRHVRPAERATAKQHVPDESLNWCFADKSYEEQLLNNLCGYGAQRRQSE